MKVWTLVAVGAVVLVAAAAFVGTSRNLRPLPKDAQARTDELRRRANQESTRCVAWVEEWEKLVGEATPEASRFRRLQEHLREYPGIPRSTREHWKLTGGKVPGEPFPDCNYYRLLSAASDMLSVENRKATEGKKNVGPLAEVLAYSLLYLVRDNLQSPVGPEPLSSSVRFVRGLATAGWLDWTDEDKLAWERAGNEAEYKAILDRSNIRAATK